MKFRDEVLLGCAVIFFAWAMTQRAARPAEIAYTCEIVKLGVELVGKDEKALVELAESYGVTVTPAQKRKARRCKVLREKSRWVKKQSAGS